MVPFLRFVTIIEELRANLTERLLYFNSKIERDLEAQMTRVWDIVRRVQDDDMVMELETHIVDKSVQKLPDKPKTKTTERRGG